MAKKVKFRFREVLSGRIPLWSSKGALGDDSLVLADESIPLAEIARASRVTHCRLVLTVDGQGMQEERLLSISRGNARRLLNELNIRSSASRASARQGQLAQSGGARSFRSAVCPFCHATIDLTDFDATSQVYCSYCEALFTPDSEGRSEEQHYRLCPRCGFYARVMRMTSFYFLYVVFSSQERHECTGCLRKGAWGRLLANIPCVLGAPVAAWQLMKIYRPSRLFRGLDRANRLALAGKIDRAMEEYDLILTELKASAGVRYNQALAMEMVGRTEEARKHLRLSLSDCANYGPVLAEMGAGLRQIPHSGVS